MSHIVKKHADLEDPVFNKCVHGEIGPKKWLVPGIIKLCPKKTEVWLVLAVPHVENLILQK